MPGHRLHVVPHEEGWAVKREGQSKVESLYSTQKDAIDNARNLARDDEVDLVVHRQDGTFRNVLTFTTDNEATAVNGRRIAAHDIVSVGCRVSWGAILAGAAIGITLNGILWLGGIALGVTLVDQVSGRALTIAGAAWMAVSTLLSLFVAGFVVSRVTAGENRTEAAMYGAILWGFFVAATLFLAAGGVSVGAEVANLGPGTGNNLQSPESLRQIG